MQQSMIMDSQSETSLPSLTKGDELPSSIASEDSSPPNGLPSPKKRSFALALSSPTRSHSEGSATPLRFGLTDQAFSSWWNAIPAEDRESFRLHGGDETCARFVCALDYLFHNDSEIPRSGAIVEAWAYAVNEEPALRHVAIEAQKVWESDAVQDLVYRINRRSMRVAKDRIVLRYTELLERLLVQSETLDDVYGQTKIAQTVEKFVNLVDREERQDAEMRLRKAYVSALENKKQERDFKTPNEEELEVFVRQLEKHFGKNKLLQLLS